MGIEVFLERIFAWDHPNAKAEEESGEEEPVMTRKEALKALNGFIRFPVEGESSLDKEEVSTLNRMERKIMGDLVSSKWQIVLGEFFRS